MLGSSDYGAQVAAHFGLPYAFAWFFTDGKGGPEALDVYRRFYQPSARHPEPHTALCVWALAAETEEEARFQFFSRARVRLLRDSGQLVPMEPPSVAAAHPYTAAELARIDQMRAQSFVGTGPQVAGRITELATRYNVQEMVVVTWAHDEAVRQTSYRLIAEAMEVAGGQTRRV
jgi:luciferase family oxidoreductase group 1